MLVTMSILTQQLSLTNESELYSEPLPHKAPMSQFLELVIGCECQRRRWWAGPEHPGCPKNLTYQGTAVPWWLSGTCLSPPWGNMRVRQLNLEGKGTKVWALQAQSWKPLQSWKSCNWVIIKDPALIFFLRRRRTLGPESEGEKLRPNLPKGNSGSC